VLTKHTYPGNVREVENIVKRMIVLGDPSLARTALTPRKLEASAAVAQRKAPPLSPSLKDVARQAARSAEREAIAKVLEDTRWNRVKAAKLLKISYRALLYKIKDVGLDRGRPESPSAT
jgi:two-component system, NtrC family, response regulator AtoC